MLTLDAFAIKKIITALFLPAGLTILVLFFFAAFARQRLRIAVTLVAIGIYVLSISPTARLVMKPLESAYYDHPAASGLKSFDAYVVLGGGIIEGAPDSLGKGALNNSSLTRSIAAFRLYQRQPKPIIFSGGSILGRTAEAELAERFLTSLGVPAHDIIMETKSTDTYENAKFTKEIADGHNLKRIVLITSASHMKRAHLLFSKRFREIMPYPTDHKVSRKKYDLLDFLPSAGNMEMIEIAVKEYLGILFYRITL